MPNGYGVSHKKVFQNIIDKSLMLKKNGTLEAKKTLSTIKLINMMYKSFFDDKWAYFDKKNITSKLGK